MIKLHIDVETFCKLDLKKVGAYKYFEHPSFEILMVAFAFDDEPVEIVDLAQGEELPQRFLDAMDDPSIQKLAHNAAFERGAFNAFGLHTQPVEWSCTAIKAAYCGLPLGLEMVSKALKLKDKAKLKTGRALIRLFCKPRKKTKKDKRTRNMPEDFPEDWAEFKKYCVQDVEAERAIENKLERYEIPASEKELYVLDQEINDRGVMVDLPFVKQAVAMAKYNKKELMDTLKEITKLENPNSPAQLKDWLSLQMKKSITSLTKDNVSTLLKDTEDEAVRKVLKLRQKTGKTSTRKYEAMLNCAADDGRVHGLLQFYGANRTGRWAGRIVQLHNLPQNHIGALALARDTIKSGDYDLAQMLYNSVPSILSQLIRTAFVAKEGHTLAVADFSAIEARVIAWLANEDWRLKVFNTHGKIYEASAAMMFGVPIEEVTKGSSLRARGKVAELALGFGGAEGALARMDRDNLLSDAERTETKIKWRKANRRIVSMWYGFDEAAKRAVKSRGKKIVSPYKNIAFYYDGLTLTIELPSGRKLFYYKPSFGPNKFGNEGLRYKGVDQTTKQWVDIETYGGKITENIVQATARDLLAVGIKRVNTKYNIIMHVHDEIVAEIPEEHAENMLENICSMLSREVSWAPGLPLGADGYITPFYKKD